MLYLGYSAAGKPNVSEEVLKARHSTNKDAKFLQVRSCDCHMTDVLSIGGDPCATQPHPDQGVHIAEQATTDWSV